MLLFAPQAPAVGTSGTRRGRLQKRAVFLQKCMVLGVDKTKKQGRQLEAAALLVNMCRQDGTNHPFVRSDRGNCLTIIENNVPGEM